MIEIIKDEDGIRIIVTNGASLEVGDRLVCPECHTAAGHLVAWFTENVVRPVRAYQLLACSHEFSTREFYLVSVVTGDEPARYEIRRVPADRRYDPRLTAHEAALWRTAGSAESSRDIFHLYGED